MPFGHDCEYATFQDCVNRNRDKDDPEAFCGALQRDTEEHCKNNKNRKGNPLANFKPPASRNKMHGRIRNFVRNFLETGPKTTERDWFKITNKKDDDGNDTTEILIFDEIGAWGTSADDFVKAINDIDSGHINLRINSPGGEVYDGIAIHNAIKFHSAKTTATVEALAASAASFIAMAADEVVMLTNSEMMIHDAAGCAFGNSADMKEAAEDLDRVSDNIASIYSERTNMPVAFWRALMKEESWFTADEAVDIGLADRVKRKEKSEEDDDDSSIEITNNWDLSIFKHRNRAAAPNPIEQIKAIVRPSAKLTTAPDKPESEPTPEDTEDNDIEIPNMKSALDSVIDPYPPFDPQDFKAITHNIVHSVPAEPDPVEEPTEDPQPVLFADLKDIVRKVIK